MSEKALITSDHLDPDRDYRSCGGKALNLSRLTFQSLPVPQWAAISAHHFSALINTHPEYPFLKNAVEQLINCDNDEIHDRCSNIQSWILELSFPEDIQKEIHNWVSGFSSDTTFAIRSSAMDEDASQASFAGMHDSYLHVESADIIGHIKKVWASVYNPRAIQYRKENQLPLEDLAMAVVIQRMINADASGVMFTINPSNQNPQQVFISAVHGLGEGLVSGALDADSFVMNKQGELITQDIVKKETAYTKSDVNRSTIHEIVLPNEQQLTPALSNTNLTAILNLGLEVEQFYGTAQDIEFALQHDQVYLLQSRPITTVLINGPAAGFHQIWDNSNIIESYSGVTRPLTFSFIRHAYRNVYESFCGVMKVPAADIEASQRVYDNMLGYLNGHVYYNLMNWYRLIQLFPGYELNKRFMESMMGVGEKLNPEDKNQEHSTVTDKLFKQWPRFISLLIAMCWRFMMIQRMVFKFDRYFYGFYDQWRVLDFNTMKPHELMFLYREMELKLLRRWRTPIINDFFVMIFYGVLKGLCKKWVGDEDHTLQNDLISGEGDIESTAPTHLLLNIASIIKSDAELTEAVLHTSETDLHSRVTKDSLFAPIRTHVLEYQERYGDRCMSELKLESVTLRDDPSFIYRMLKNYLRMHELPDINDQDDQQIRREAEAKAFKSLGWGIKRVIFKRVLNAARRGVKNRENMRLARTRIYGLVRRIFRSIAAQWASDEIIDDPDDIFFLTVDEVWDYVQGTAVTVDLKSLIELRRAEQSRFETVEEPADRFSTWGSPYFNNSFEAISDDELDSSLAPGQLKGIGCSPGEVQGIAKVILSPEADMQLDGEILVAGRTDPGWVVLYPSISGLLIERGSILSHSAIVAREMGIPTIVGIKGLIKTVRTGDKLKMNGASGELWTMVQNPSVSNPIAEPET